MLLSITTQVLKCRRSVFRTRFSQYKIIYNLFSLHFRQPIFFFLNIYVIKLTNLQLLPI